MSCDGLPNTKSVHDFIGYIRERLERSTTTWQRSLRHSPKRRKCSAERVTRSETCARRRTSARARLISSPPSRRVSGSPNIARSSRWFIAGARSRRHSADGREVQGPLRALQSRQSECVRTDPHSVDGRSGSQGDDREVEPQSLATIYVDVDAMKADLFDGDHIARLEEVSIRFRRRCPTSRSRSQVSRNVWS